jgi:hypothetical protein
MPRIASSILLSTLLVAPLLLAPYAASAACPSVGAQPATFPDGLEVRPWSLTLSGGNQELCVFLENTSTSAISPAVVDHQMEEPGTGVPGPWPLLSSSPINISGGVTAICSTSGNVGTTTVFSGSLAPGAISDICCFVLQNDGGSGCSNLPDDGDLVRNTSASGDVVLMPLGVYDPVGGTTCGLIGLEPLLALSLLGLAGRTSGHWRRHKYKNENRRRS